VTAAIDFGAALTWTAFANLAFNVEVTPVRTFLVFAVILLTHGLLNTFGVNLVKLLSNVSAWWHLVGVAVIVAVLTFVPDKHQSLSYTLFHYESHFGWTNPIYVFAIGLLMAQYTFTGFDASAHVPRRRTAPPPTHPRAS